MSLYTFKKGFVELVNSLDVISDREQYISGLKTLYADHSDIIPDAESYILSEQANIDISNGYVEEDAPQSGE